MGSNNPWNISQTLFYHHTPKIGLELWNPTGIHLGCLCPARREKPLCEHRLAHSTHHTSHSRGSGAPLTLISLLKHQKTKTKPALCITGVFAWRAALLWKTWQVSKAKDVKLHQVLGLLILPGVAGILFVVMDKEEGSWSCCLGNSWDTVPQIRLFSLLSQYRNPFSLPPTLGFSVYKSSVMLNWP